MSFQYLTNLPLDKAKTEYIDRLIQNGMAPKTETISVTQAAGRITAEPVYARINSPHYNACAMDGIALMAHLTFGAGETTPVSLTAEQYTRVNTGDKLPDNCDAVVMIEDVIECDDSTIKLYDSASPWQHIRQIGEDICAGEMLLPSRSRLTPASLGAMIAGGLHQVEVIKRPIAGIIPTGDELVPPTKDPEAGDILEFNSTIFSAMLRDWGAEAVTYPIVEDNLDSLRTAIASALKECDIVLVNAGSSAGSKDYAAEAIAANGEVLYHGIAIKPGKPAILGLCGDKPILGVPGYPVSGIIVIEELLRPIVEYLCRMSQDPAEYTDATLSKSIVSTLKYQEFVRVRMGLVNSKLIATPLSRGSGVVTSFMKADGIVNIPQGVEGFESGETVRIRLLRSKEALSRSIVAIGSHDPLLDELTELLQRATDGQISLGSSHVGSMGGIMAVRRGEAHIAATHLLDEKTGEYNIPFIKRYFPNGGVRLVECVKRTQGLILQKGNPKNITDISGLKQEGLRYVNRQKGSGTRVLLDYLCKNEGIDTSSIYGYEREEYTHTAVAALIAADSADAGLGIYSVSKLYDLDFVPVCNERYDLLIPDYAWDSPSVQAFLEVLKSSAFRQKLDDLGGYTVENPGTVIF
ncbi:MAG: molybdopterin biosynthesis protein [Oscillospiraceae bacterium]|nr:molybdopterin biosynthesis protein [Oscillospiraceae bacterium]